MSSLVVDNYIIDTPLPTIVERLKLLTDHKLKDVHVTASEIILTCVNAAHNNAEESHPDAHINLNPDKAGYGIYHCFACDIATDFIGFLALFFESSRDYAKNWLITNYGQKCKDTIQIDTDIILRPYKRTTHPIVLDESELLQYQTWTPYFSQRRLSRQTAEKFNLRYDPINRQVIFPIYDNFNQLIMLAKRSIDTKIFYMTQGVEKPVYCLDYINKNNISTAVICEGPFDCLTAYEYGYAAIATLGNISDFQIEQINKSCIKHLYLCMDNDTTGKKMTTFLNKKLSPRILRTIVSFPRGKKDINDLTKAEFDFCIKSAK